MRACPGVVGFCYTQLLDTVQEAQGLLTADRKPKLSRDAIRAIVIGEPPTRPAPTSTLGWHEDASGPG